MSSIAQQILTMFERDKDITITIKTAKGLEFTGKIIMLDNRSVGIEQDNGQNDLLFIRHILEVTEAISA